MTNIPPLPRFIGLSGLLPQLACVLAVWFGPLEWRFWALAIGWAYAALILSFLGGLWWGLLAAEASVSQSNDQRHLIKPWMWTASVMPSLWALLTYVPWIIGANWPGPSLVGLGLALMVSLWIDRRLAAALSIIPGWWMSLRVPLSLGLGIACILLALG